MRGVINLRGAVMPVIDLGSRLGMSTSEPTARHVIIVARVGEHSVGLVVDAVCETFAVTPDQVQPLPELGGDAMKSVVRGFLQIDERMISLISLDRILEDAVAESQAVAA
jgi:purine-binding chemotaxis protein CheW